MTFQEFVSQGWRDHAKDAEGVFARMPEGIAAVQEPDNLGAYSALCVHVAGEHLGRWGEGIALLERLTRLPVFDPDSSGGKSVMRSMAVLHRCAGNHEAENRCFAASRSGLEFPPESDRIRLLAITASALVGQKRLSEARRDFEEAVSLAAYGPGASDPAARALAVTGNNLACELEDVPVLMDDEKGMMLRAAEVARRFWEVAGGWREVGRAEYRLAMSHIKAGEFETALLHAGRCREIVARNGDEPGEAFFAHEAFARAHLARGERAAAREERGRMAGLLPGIEEESFRSTCEGELAKLDQDLSGR